MASAADLLTLAASEPDRLRRHLLVAAAFRDALPHEPIIVGGTAEEYWTREYHQTDLDLCAPLDRTAVERLEQLSFRQRGRHWVNDAIAAAVEFPESRIDGDESRTGLVEVGGGFARIIGVDDLYIDRLRQATLREDAEDIHFYSALAVSLACYEDLDRRYLRQRIQRIEEDDPLVATAMRRVDRRIATRTRRELGG